MACQLLDQRLLFLGLLLPHSLKQTDEVLGTRWLRLGEDRLLLWLRRLNHGDIVEINMVVVNIVVVVDHGVRDVAWDAQ